MKVNIGGNSPGLRPARTAAEAAGVKAGMQFGAVLADQVRGRWTGRRAAFAAVDHVPQDILNGVRGRPCFQST
jgi:hypothetical protein